MRCTTKFTVIVQCFAAYMWRRAGLLTKDDCDQLINDSVLSADDNGKRYEPHDFERFTHKIQYLAEPIHGENPLELEDAGSTTAFDHYQIWKEQLLKGILKIYVKQTYERDSLQKRSEANAVDPATFVNEHAAELRQFFTPSERLRKSYSYARILLLACDDAFYKFRDILYAVNVNSHIFSSFVKEFGGDELDRLDEAVVDRLNAFREALDSYSNMAGGGGFQDSKYNGALGARVTRVINDQFMDSFKECCKEALAYIYLLPEKISKDIVKFTTYCREGVKDAFEYLHFVYPELDYKGWGSFWRKARIQVTIQLKALERHVDEVYNFRSNNLKVEPGLFEEIDIALAEQSRARQSDHESTPENTDEIIAGEIKAVAKAALSRICEAITKEANIDGAALAEELETPADEMEK
ncbi:hypothetical protein PAPHI01_2085 [Pancytospora philotis]|nr:hypothetical protein PAPHI01_2085 [Pancytospora philotis]